MRILAVLATLLIGTTAAAAVSAQSLQPFATFTKIATDLLATTRDLTRQIRHSPPQGPSARCLLTTSTWIGTCARAARLPCPRLQRTGGWNTLVRAQLARVGRLRRLHCFAVTAASSVRNLAKRAICGVRSRWSAHPQWQRGRLAQQPARLRQGAPARLSPRGCVRVRCCPRHQPTGALGAGFEFDYGSVFLRVGGDARHALLKSAPSYFEKNETSPPVAQGPGWAFA
jgi:hypothetical protein